MVKTEGEPGADFEKEWKKNPKFAALLLKELKKHKPKIIVVMSQKVYKLFRDDPRFSQWKERVQQIYHPAYVVRYRKFSAWKRQFKKICGDLKYRHHTMNRTKVDVYVEATGLL